MELATVSLNFKEAIGHITNVANTERLLMTPLANSSRLDDKEDICSDVSGSPVIDSGCHTVTVGDLDSVATAGEIMSSAPSVSSAALGEFRANLFYKTQLQKFCFAPAEVCKQAADVAAEQEGEDQPEQESHSSARSVGSLSPAKSFAGF